jgi:hypothetical protein
MQEASYFKPSLIRHAMATLRAVGVRIESSQDTDYSDVARFRLMALSQACFSAPVSIGSTAN